MDEFFHLYRRNPETSKKYLTGERIDEQTDVLYDNDWKMKLTRFYKHQSGCI